ncbi:MAG: MarR family winged helix-turn-helix transcriptional regulator [Acidimicrobiales bacterium]|jgi:DNA-binding MarR family transcriptional regulator
MADGHSDAGLEEVVDGLLEVADRVHHVVCSVAARHDLTPQQVGLLRMLAAPVSMRAFAEELSCDPSNVTGLVDRAERLGLVERVPDPGDRRVRILKLTTKGRNLRSTINREVARSLTDALGLSTDDHAKVMGVLGAMTSATKPPRTD